jgi:hypothetical protein
MYDIRRFWRKTMRKGVGSDWLRSEALSVGTSDFSAREESALALNKVIQDWATTARLVR